MRNGKRPTIPIRIWIWRLTTIEIEQMSGDPDWLNKAIRIVEKQIQDMNKTQRGNSA
jgi:hypothetical protein